MKFGVFDHLDHGGESLHEHYESRLKLIEAYDRAGLHAYFVAEHHSTPLGMAPSPSVFLSAVAQRTTRLRFGPMVYTLNLYHPLRLLEEICMLDQLSGGRLELGTGRGISPIEIRYYGGDPAVAQALYEEVLAILRQGFGAETLDFAGRFYQFKDVPLVLSPLQRPHPPFWYGAAKAESAVLPARQGINLATNQPLAKCRAITDRYRAEWAALGRDPAALPFLGMTRHIVVADTDREALAIARRAYPLFFAAFMNLFRKHGINPANLSYPETFDELLEAGEAIAGSPATVRDLLGRQTEAAGVNYLLCRFAFGDMTLDESLRSLELMTREVIPAFAADSLTV